MIQKTAGEGIGIFLLLSTTSTSSQTSLFFEVLIALIDGLHLLILLHLLQISSGLELAQVLQTKPIRYLIHTYNLIHTYKFIIIPASNLMSRNQCFNFRPKDISFSVTAKNKTPWPGKNYGTIVKKGSIC